MKNMTVMKINESLLVAVDFTNGEDVGVLIVGRKRPNQSVDIINDFQGKEAEELYNKLIGKKGVLVIWAILQITHELGYPKFED